MEILGVDIGGSGIKAAVVDVEKGALRGERVDRKTPRPARPEPMIEIVAELVREIGWKGPVGCGFPGVVRQGRVVTAPNLSEHWVGEDAAGRIAAACGLPTTVINDADAAGLAEMRFGAAHGHDGVVLLLTLGTGIGSALFCDGVLIPNTELGHAEVGGREAEERAAASVREKQKLTWECWTAELNRVLQYFELILNPDLIVIGGGISSEHERFLPRLELHAEVIPAQLFNDAGVVGAALAALVGAAPGARSTSGNE
jgi:polyphosphate glucokinase